MGDLASLFSKGLQESIIDPLTADWKDAYWMQRAARERYPVTDAVTNFVPYLGTALNADDAIQHIRSNQYSGVPGDLAGMALNIATVKGGGKFVSEVSRDAQRMGRSGGKAMAIGVGFPAAAYITSYLQDQQDANKKYGDTSLKDIANILRNR